MIAGTGHLENRMSMENREGYIWWGGELIAWRDARLHMFSSTVQHGAGVFEGIRAYSGARGTAVFRLREHTERLFDSAKILQIPVNYSPEQLEAGHIRVIQENRLVQCYI